jgi:hypothetical protein
MKRLIAMLLAAAFGVALLVAQVASGPNPRGPAQVYEQQQSPVGDSSGIEVQVREGGWGEPDGSEIHVVIWGFPFPIVIVIGDAEIIEQESNEESHIVGGG